MFNPAEDNRKMQWGPSKTKPNAITTHPHEKVHAGSSR